MAKAAMPISNEEEMIEVALSEATHGQLIWFCKMQGYEYDEAETQNQTLNRINTAWDHPTITVPKVIEGKRPAMQVHTPIEINPLEDRYGLPEKVTVSISHSEDDAPDSYEDLAHNGVVFRVKRGIPVEIPWYVFKGCLDDARQIRYTSGRDTGIGEPRFVHAVPFSRVK